MKFGRHVAMLVSALVSTTCYVRTFRFEIRVRGLKLGVTLTSCRHLGEVRSHAPEIGGIWDKWRGVGADTVISPNGTSWAFGGAKGISRQEWRIAWPSRCLAILQWRTIRSGRRLTDASALLGR